MRFLISKFYTQPQLDTIWSHIGESEWVNGLVSVPNGSEDRKKCLQLLDPLGPCLWPGIDGNLDFYNFAYPVWSRDPLVTKTEVGGYYKPHYDLVSNGHFSTTIFLSDPEDYDGGELVIWIDGREEFFKLPAGYGITYETGLGHRVNTVTRGERVVAAFWTHSYMSDLEDLKEWRYWRSLVNWHREKYGEKPPTDDLKDFCSSSEFYLANRMVRIMKRYINIIPQDRILHW